MQGRQAAGGGPGVGRPPAVPFETLEGVRLEAGEAELVMPALDREGLERLADPQALGGRAAAEPHERPVEALHLLEGDPPPVAPPFRPWHGSHVRSEADDYNTVQKDVNGNRPWT